MKYTELQVTTNFSFLRGASDPIDLIATAAEYGYDAIGITDRNSFAGVVRAHVAAKVKGMRIIPGCRIDLLDGPSLLVYPTNKSAYTKLSALLTKGNLRAEKGDCHLYKKDVYETAGAIKFIVVPPPALNNVFDFEPSFLNVLQEYKNAFGNEIFIGASRQYQGQDAKYIHRLFELSKETGVPMVATNDVHYHNPACRQLQDVLTCIREKCTIQDAGFRLHQNAERHIKTIGEMHRLFKNYPAAINRSNEIADACTFSLEELKYEYPHEITTKGRTPQEEVIKLAWEGAKYFFPKGVSKKTARAINHELYFIKEMNYAPYFLTVYDIVRFARSKNILCQGRGSAANSTVCYCLGITAVNPEKFELLFERFISSARNEPPDIDVDFEHERREEVIQYIYEKYGRDRAAIVATVTQERQKGAIRDVGKAMGLSVDVINQLSGTEWELSDDWFDGKGIKELGLNPNDKKLKQVMRLTGELMGFPRQLGQHTGGFVITRGKLTDLCPILNARMENRTCIEWNKDDIDALGFLKIDVLALGMLTCIRKAFDLIKESYGGEYTLANIPQDDKNVYEMICRADTIGVFQIESRAQQAMLPRLKPRCFYDLVIEVAIVRPGPIQGDMVHPYLKRRENPALVEYPSKELEEILKRTLGVPLFQEQAMKIAIVAAGFTATEADELRRSMATFKAKGQVSQFEKKLIKGMINNGYSAEYAQRVFRQLEGFGSYGFPESHAASFALLVYVSSWIKCYYPDVFACALLNSMPMGFYQPAQIIGDARKHEVLVREVDINYSTWDNNLEKLSGKYCALRLGFRQVKGLRVDDMELLVSKRNDKYESIDAMRDAGISSAVMEKLADADAFRSLGLDRREALWQISACNDRPHALFAGQVSENAMEQKANLPVMTKSEHVVHDYASTSLSLKAHPISFAREKLDQLKITRAIDLPAVPHDALVKVAGLVLVRQRPGTAKGVCFITLEDETGFVNLVVFPNLYDEFRKPIIQSRMLMVEGKMQREGQVIHVILQRCYNITKLLSGLTASREENLPVLTLSRADETSVPAHAAQKRKSALSTDLYETVYPKGRNFR